MSARAANSKVTYLIHRQKILGTAKEDDLVALKLSLISS